MPDQFMRRLVFVCPGVPGGVRSFITNLAVFLRQEGIDHRILFYEKDEGITTKILRGPIPGSLLLRYSRYASLRSIYKDFAGMISKDDVLICSDSLELEAINFLRPANRVIFILHGDLDHYMAILKNYEPILDHVFCVSRGLQEKYSALFPGLSFSVTHPLIANFAAARSPHPGLLLGVFIGRFEYMKGADDFLRVVKGAMKEGVPIHWKVFVTRKGADPILISEIPAEVELVYDLPNDKVLSALENADLLLFPSRSEGFGIVVPEAMKRGVVPVARNLPIGAVPDLITDRQTGYLARDHSEMLSVVRELNLDRDMLDRTGKAAAQYANAAFDFDKMGRLFLESTGKVAGGPVKAGKNFLPVKERPIEKYLPEPIFRFMKKLYHLSSRGSTT